MLRNAKNQTTSVSAFCVVVRMLCSRTVSPLSIAMRGLAPPHLSAAVLHYHALSHELQLADRKVQ